VAQVKWGGGSGQACCGARAAFREAGDLARLQTKDHVSYLRKAGAAADSKQAHPLIKNVERSKAKNPLESGRLGQEMPKAKPTKPKKAKKPTPQPI
jgi:hypothetical protein